VPGGVLFGEPSAAALAEAIERFEREPFDLGALREFAGPFAAERFDREFLAAFHRHYSEHLARRAARSDPRAAGESGRRPDQSRAASAER
jgi:hypothetical protein